jgi:hypothetical protein
LHARDGKDSTPRSPIRSPENPPSSSPAPVAYRDGDFVASARAIMIIGVIGGIGIIPPPMVPMIPSLARADQGVRRRTPFSSCLPARQNEATGARARELDETRCHELSATSLRIPKRFAANDDLRKGPRAQIVLVMAARRGRPTEGRRGLRSSPRRVRGSIPNRGRGAKISGTISKIRLGIQWDVAETWDTISAWRCSTISARPWAPQSSSGKTTDFEEMPRRAGLPKITPALILAFGAPPSRREAVLRLCAGQALRPAPVLRRHGRSLRAPTTWRRSAAS